MIPTALVSAAFLMAPSPDGGSSALMGPIVMYGLIFAIFYFILLRPQQRQRKQHEQLVQELKKGDEVVTAGGVVGEVLHIKETMKDGTPQKTLEDRITIKSGESRLVIERGRITRVIKPSAASTPAP